MFSERRKEIYVSNYIVPFILQIKHGLPLFPEQEITRGKKPRQKPSDIQLNSETINCSLIKEIVFALRIENGRFNRFPFLFQKKSAELVLPFVRINLCCLLYEMVQYFCNKDVLTRFDIETGRTKLLHPVSISGVDCFLRSRAANTKTHRRLVFTNYRWSSYIIAGPAFQNDQLMSKHRIKLCVHLSCTIQIYRFTAERSISSLFCTQNCTASKLYTYNFRHWNYKLHYTYKDGNKY